MPAKGTVSELAAGPHASDVAVSARGIIGLASAWRAARRGLRVVVLERADAPGAGASGVAAGMLAPVTEADFGEEELLALEPRAAGALAGVRGASSRSAPAARPVPRERRARGRGRPRRRRGAAPPARAAALARARQRVAQRRALPRARAGLSPRIAGGIDAPRRGPGRPARRATLALAEARRRGRAERASRSPARRERRRARDGRRAAPAGTIEASRSWWPPGPGRARSPRDGFRCTR